MAILVPVYLAYFLAGLEAERFKAFASFALFVLFYVFGQFAIYRARRYRRTRTVWRGVRFWMSGSGWAYAARAALWGLLVMVTLGLALPWRNAALERYKMRHSFYGDLQGSFEGRGWEFFKSQGFLKSIALLVLAGLGYLMVVLAINVVMRVYLMRDLWVRIVGSTIVLDIGAAANVSARGELANALGEGFADGLDVAGF